MTKREFEELKFEDKLAEQLLTKHGPLMSGDELWRALGYSSVDAFRKARIQNRLEIDVFSLPNRRGTFAFTRHVADWIKNLAMEVNNRNKDYKNLKPRK